VVTDTYAVGMAALAMAYSTKGPMPLRGAMQRRPIWGSLPALAVHSRSSMVEWSPGTTRSSTCAPCAAAIVAGCRFPMRGYLFSGN
jgi:hypothetical protein